MSDTIKPMTVRLLVKRVMVSNVDGDVYAYDSRPTLQQYTPDDFGECEWVDINEVLEGL